MPTSSGQLAGFEVASLGCLACEWHGQIDVWIDPIYDHWSWDCPTCTTTHTEALR